MSVKIRDVDFKVVSETKNLRGITDYCAKGNTVERIDLYGPEQDGTGQLGIAWHNGSTCITEFQSYSIMREWARKRRCLREAKVYEHNPKSVFPVPLMPALT